MAKRESSKSKSDESEGSERKVLSENELKLLRARFKKRQNKFTAVAGTKRVRIAAKPPSIPVTSDSALNDDDTDFEEVKGGHHPAKTRIFRRKIVLGSSLRPTKPRRSTLVKSTGKLNDYETTSEMSNEIDSFSESVQSMKSEKSFGLTQLVKPTQKGNQESSKSSAIPKSKSPMVKKTLSTTTTVSPVVSENPQFGKTKSPGTKILLTAQKTSVSTKSSTPIKPISCAIPKTGISENPTVPATVSLSPIPQPIERKTEKVITKAEEEFSKVLYKSKTFPEEKAKDKSSNVKEKSMNVAVKLSKDKKTAGIDSSLSKSGTSSSTTSKTTSKKKVNKNNNKEINKYEEQKQKLEKKVLNDATIKKKANLVVPAGTNKNTSGKGNVHAKLEKTAKSTEKKTSTEINTKKSVEIKKTTKLSEVKNYANTGLIKSEKNDFVGCPSKINSNEMNKSSQIESDKEESKENKLKNFKNTKVEINNQTKKNLDKILTKDSKISDREPIAVCSKASTKGEIALEPEKTKRKSDFSEGCNSIPVIQNASTRSATLKVESKPLPEQNKVKNEIANNLTAALDNKKNSVSPIVLTLDSNLDSTSPNTSTGGNTPKIEDTPFFSRTKPPTVSNELITQTRIQQKNASEAGSDSSTPVMIAASKDSRVFEELEDEIVLDTNTLQSIADDLSKGSKTIDRSILGDDLADKLIEIEKTQANSVEEVKDILNEPVVVSDVASKVVEKLTSNNVLGQVLTPEESDVLCKYFERKRPLDEEVLAVLDTALDKVLARANEFCDDKELTIFLKDPDLAKAQLLDALIAKKADFLRDLMSTANNCSQLISKGVIDAFLLASKGILVLRDQADMFQNAIVGGIRQSMDIAGTGLEYTYDMASAGKEMAIKGTDLLATGVSSGLSIATTSAELATDACITAKDTGIKAVGQGLQYSKDIANAGTQITYEAANKGKAYVSSGLEAVNKTAEVVNEKLATAALTTQQSIITAKDMLDQATSGVAQAGTEVIKASSWVGSWFTSAVNIASSVVAKSSSSLGLKSTTNDSNFENSEILTEDVTESESESESD